LQMIIVYPGFPVSTRDIFGRLKLDLTERSDNDNICRLTNELRTGCVESVVPRLFNRLERTTLTARPELNSVKQLMAREGLLGVTMTGSGSCFFGLCERKEVASEKARNLTASGVGLAIACETTRE